jgi:hypothetical protein
VAYRSPFPDQKTVELVKEELEKRNIHIKKLLEWQRVKCP